MPIDDSPQVEQALRFAVKKELRKRMRGVRSTVPPAAARARSEALSARLGSLEIFERAGAVALFWPIEGRNEVDLRPLAARLAAEGKAIFYPRIDAQRDQIGLFRWAPGEAMIEGPLGILEPPEGAAEAGPGEVTLVVVPALAMDPRGHRIGYGRGFYDRMLPRYAPPAATVGVVFDFQLISEVPFTAGDVSLGWVVTDCRAFVAGEPTRGEPPLRAGPAEEARPAGAERAGLGGKPVARPGGGQGPWTPSGPRSSGSR